ncbi:hypothetical protein L9T92_11500, partial [Pseudomonas putida]|nr:hypothetical protein [Pseudomonas putida]
GHLLDRFDLEFFGVTLTTHGTSYLGLIMRLGGVYETRGDSDIYLNGKSFTSACGHRDLRFREASNKGFRVHAPDYSISFQMTWGLSAIF